MRPPLDYARDQPGILEHPEMPAQRRLRHPEAARRLADRRGPERETLDDATPDRVPKRLKRNVSHLANNPTTQPRPREARRYVVPLQGKNAVIYGAGGSIGAAVA